MQIILAWPTFYSPAYLLRCCSSRISLCLIPDFILCRYLFGVVAACPPSLKCITAGTDMHFNSHSLVVSILLGTALAGPIQRYVDSAHMMQCTDCWPDPTMWSDTLMNHQNDISSMVLRVHEDHPTIEDKLQQILVLSRRARPHLHQLPKNGRHNQVQLEFKSSQSPLSQPRAQNRLRTPYLVKILRRAH
jgi:hypothetical protein